MEFATLVSSAVSSTLSSQVTDNYMEIFRSSMFLCISRSVGL